MSFASIEFLFIFLPLVLIIYYALKANNVVLLCASLAFIFSSEGWFIWVLLLSTSVNFVFSIQIYGSADAPMRRAFLAGGVVFNVILLTYFKYASFLASMSGNTELENWFRTIHLPAGISFFTFHAISYLVDIYRGKARAETSLTNFALYMTNFPQLIAGPIVRFSTVAGQLRRRVVTARHVYYGLVLFCMGLGQKVLIADTLASVVDPLFKISTSLSFEAAWAAAIFYTLQIYFDFGGYSNMAIGLGLLFGFFFPRNFNYPYISQSITEFWRRWHMSLSAWFRDYVYVPLGGNRHGKFQTLRNLFIVFLLCGLWHGAAWTFVIWGVYHGVLLVLERIGFGRFLERLPIVVRHVYALLAVVVGWVLFRAETLSQAGDLYAKMFLGYGRGQVGLSEFVTGEVIVAFLAGALFSTPLVAKLFQASMPLIIRVPLPSRASLKAYWYGAAFASCLFLLSAIRVLSGSYSPFIYFRF